jgi:hypothetical protein
MKGTGLDKPPRADKNTRRRHDTQRGRGLVAPLTQYPWSQRSDYPVGRQAEQAAGRWLGFPAGPVETSQFPQTGKA